MWQLGKLLLSGSFFDGSYLVSFVGQKKCFGGKERRLLLESFKRFLKSKVFLKEYFKELICSMKSDIKCTVGVAYPLVWRILSDQSASGFSHTHTHTHTHTHIYIYIYIYISLMRAHVLVCFK